MAWSDIFTGDHMTTSEQEANLARIQQLQAQRLAARQQAGTIDQAKADFYQQDQSVTLDSQNAAAALGAISGATELVTNPSQWLTDTKEGGKMVGSAVDKGMKSLSKWTDNLAWGAFKKALSWIPWWAYLAGAAWLFWWLGGGLWLERKARKAFK
jgi:hypothetical protein